MIEARVIANSISPQGIKLPTLMLRYPKFIHGELMTHRVFSRNASSSRAIPVRKMLYEVRSAYERVMPVSWPAEQKGMQGGDELEGQALSNAQAGWVRAALYAADQAEAMVKAGLHKSLANRILEPFSHINVLVTSTEWDNFFGLRLDRAAQPEMRALAVAMWEALKGSTPRLLLPGQWHLPFVSDEEMAEKDWSDDPVGYHIKVSVARCARVSYLSNDTGKRSTVEEDLKLYDRLMANGTKHASHAEHQATPDRYVVTGTRSSLYSDWTSPHEHGNFKGWRQYRKMIAGEAVAPLPEEFK